MFWSLHPHKAPIWMNCAGSAQLESGAPKEDPGQPRLEGDAAHEVAMKILRGEASGVGEFINTNAPNGIFIDAVMADHVETYVDHVRAQAGAGYIEVPGTLTPNIKGVVDHYAVVPGTLRTTEFKYGWSPVEAKDNWQLIVNSLMAAKQHASQISEYHMTVVQPRAPHKEGKIRTWTISADEMEHYRSEILTQEDIAMSAEAPLKTGNHCHHCDARGVCPAAKVAGLLSIEIEGKAIAEELSPVQVAEELRLMQSAEQRIKDRRTGLETVAKAMLKGGQPVPGYSIEPSYGNRKWKKGVTSATIEMMTGVDISKNDLMTPAEAQRAGVSEHTVNAYTTRSISSQKLTYQDTQDKSKELFGNG